MDEQPICQKCINFIVRDDLVFCDYDNFIDEKIENAILFVPEMFDCDFWEKMEC
jgi:hypothetical protein